MKEGHSNSSSRISAKDKKMYLYLVLGSIGFIVILSLIISSLVMASNKGNDIGGDIASSNSSSDTGSDSDNDGPVDIIEESFIAPLDVVVVMNDYGFYHNKTLNNFYMHTGIDFKGDKGVAVKSVASGKVEKIYSSDMLLGNQIVIDHGDGLKTVYSYVTVKEGLEIGDKVSQGEIIGSIAEKTGNEYKDGEHLHFEVHENGTPVDPNKFLTLDEK